MPELVDFTEIHFQDADELEVFNPETAARELLGYALDSSASDVFITDEATYVGIRMRRMGRVELVQKLSREAGRRLQNHFRAIGGADVADHINPVEGRNVIEIDDDRSVDVRISALPNIYGQDLALRLFNAEKSLLSLDQLGLLPSELAAVRDLLQASSGLLLVCGPTNSGKTSTLYACLRYLNRGESKIHTIEEPVEFSLPGIVQSQVNLRAGVDYDDLLYSVLRHAPDIIMLGEIRDARTAQIAIQAGGSGQLVLASIHARTAIGAIQTMAAYGVNRHFLASSLLGVISQRLVRRLCHRCRFEVDVSDVESFLRELEDEMPRTQRDSLFMPVGCEACVDGYDQLTCVPEVLKVDASLRRAIADQVDFGRIDQLARRGGMVPFRKAAQRRLALGLTTVEELIRVLPEEETFAAGIADLPVPVDAPDNGRL